MDIVERSQKAQEAINQMIGENSILKVINERQLEEIKRLREALKEILTHETDYEPYDCIEIARAVLKESE